MIFIFILMASYLQTFLFTPNLLQLFKNFWPTTFSKKLSLTMIGMEQDFLVLLVMLLSHQTRKMCRTQDNTAKLHQQSPNMAPPMHWDMRKSCRYVTHQLSEGFKGTQYAKRQVGNTHPPVTFTDTFLYGHHLTITYNTPTGIHPPAMLTNIFLPGHQSIPTQ